MGDFTVDNDPNGLVRITARQDEKISSISMDAATAVRLSDAIRKHAGAPNPWTTRQKLLAFTNAAFFVFMGLAFALALFSFGVGFGQDVIGRD